MYFIRLLPEGTTPTPGDEQMPLTQPAMPSIFQNCMPGESPSPSEHKTAERRPRGNTGPLYTEVRNSHSVVFHSVIPSLATKTNLNMVEIY